MEGQEGMDPAARDGRWTCDACGCHTNTAENPVICNICGTRRIPAFLRRAGRSAASRLLAHHYSFARGNLDDDEIFDEDGMEVQFGAAMMGIIDPEEQAVAALALEVAGITGAARIPGAHSVLSRRQRFPNAPAPGEDDRLLPPPEPPETLWQLAVENAEAYQPKWTMSAHRGGRSRHNDEIELGALQNVARIADGVAEGRAVRASEPLPRTTHRNQRDHSDTASQGSHQRKVFGFRVVFDHPYREPGMSLGDCYLVGVTTSSFSAYGERNGLLQSPYFWGVEDSGSQFEGPRRRRESRPASSANGIEIGSRDLPRNSDNVLFGARETVSVVVDLENRSMSFWRDGDFLGTLVRNLPRSGHLYPVVVPFNSGVSFAITGMDRSPLPCVERFTSSRREREDEKANRRRQELASKRALLIQNGRLAPGLIAVLKKIFYAYSSLNDERLAPEQLLGIVAASRLWYRSGLSLPELCTLVEAKVAHRPGAAASLYDNAISADDFLECINRAVKDDIAVSGQAQENGPVTFEVGDKVELVDCYAKFGDASGGPLQLGDRGTVIEMKQGPNQEPFAIHVTHYDRQWWYEPQALLSERSGLVDSSSVWFLHKVLRSHGYDQNTLEPLWGKPLSTSWEVGDLVVPRAHPQRNTGMDDADTPLMERDCFGRIVAETKDSLLSTPVRGRRNTVLVEFAEPSFGVATGLLNRASEIASNLSLQVRRIPIDKLQYENSFFGPFGTKHDFDSINRSMSDGRLNAELANLTGFNVGGAEGEESDHADLPKAAMFLINSKLRSEIQAVSCLDPTAIQSVARTCEERPCLSASIFGSGLCDAILSGVSLAEQNAARGKINDGMRAAVSSLGLLSSILCNRLLSSNDGRESAMEEWKETAQDEDTNLSTVLAAASRSAAVPAEEGQTSWTVRADFLDTTASRRMLSGAALSSAGQRGHHRVRTRARYSNSTSSRSSRDEWNIDGQAPSDARSLIYNGLLMNSLSWVNAGLRSAHEGTKTSAGSESFSSTMSNARDKHGMSLLLLAVVLGCSTDIVHHLLLSEATIGETEIKAAALSNQPHLLSVLLQHSVCRKQLIESLQVSPDVAAVFRAAEAQQKYQEQILRRKADTFASALIVRLCRLGSVCRSGPSRIRCFGRAASEALVGNVLLRALHENQQKALAAASPRRRKHGGSAHPVSDAESERLSLSDPWGVSDSEVYASAAAMSPKHGVLLVLPGRFFCDGFLCGPPQTRDDRLSVLLSFVESLLWSKEKEDAAAGLTILRSLLEKVPLIDISREIERYGLADLILTHELIARRRLADIKSRKRKTKTILGSNSEAMKDGSRGNKKRPRPLLAANASNAGEVVLCPKFHVAELHLTKHSSFRCDICGKGVLRDRPMHGCRECDWDACERCMDQNEGGTVKWGYILELAVSCRKLLEDSDAALKSSDGLNRMNLEESLEDSKRGIDCPDFSRLARQLRLRDESALTDLVSKMESSDHMTNHEFVSFVLPALHAALVDTHGATIQKDRFCLHALHTFADFVKPQAAEARSDDDSHMSIEDIPSPDDDDESMEGTSQREKVAPVYRVPSSALRRLQDILAFSENMSVLHAFRSERNDGKCTSPNGSRLQSLTQPIELHVSPMNAPQAASDLTVFVEPLLPTKELQLHVIRVCRILDSSYLAFCRSLAKASAVIVERPIRIGQEETSSWQIAQVVGFDEDTGSHSLRYPSTLTDEVRRSDRHARVIPFEGIKFHGDKGRLVLAAREYFILHRSEYKSLRRGKSDKMVTFSPQGVDRDDSASLFPPETVPTGARVESNCVSPDHAWLPFTVVSRSAGRADVRYDIVSDHGEVFRDVCADQIRGCNSRSVDSGPDGEVPRNLRDALDLEPPRNALRLGGALPFPFFRMGRHVSEERASQQRDAEARSTPETGVLKRTWSALSPLNDMCPLDVVLTPESQVCWEGKASAKLGGRSWRCCIGGEDVEVFSRDSAVELPPKLWVDFSAHEGLPTVDVSTCHGEAVVHMLHRLLQRHDETKNEGSLLYKKHRLYYNIRCQVSPDSTASWVEGASAGCASLMPYNGPDDGTMAIEDCFQADLQGISEWLNGTSLQCMEVMNVLATYAEEGALSSEERSDLYFDSSEPQDKVGSLLSSLENESLSQKLRDQLEDPLMVVGGVLPEWCLAAPSIAPRVFSYSSRRQLLLRTAFGVSRSTLKQQEAKVAVGPLRQRMSMLRGRAVELMGEAFSGHVEDPTVLQLQADELYGMEEALAARVSSAFRAERWQERSLRCAKAAVRRGMLLSDAATLMERYANDDRLRHRRLEVRFDGESGFDAASGDAAGVTRGFYADVAEALLSCDHVATVYCPVACLDDVSDLQTFSEDARMKLSVQCRLPLWFPDMDSSRQVVIPTPRASPNSTPGVYPRPLSPKDPLLPLVRQRFRFMGRLFAAAMRDGLMFPLQLSASFLKLVQNPLCDSQSNAVARASSESKVISNHVAGSKFLQRSLPMHCARATPLTSDDLPRPGFLGGEVYAVEMHICAALDRIDEAEPSRSPFEADVQRQKIASDHQFARLALGKSYDCSFNEYFEDRTFVDPLSPTQGEDAAPLCPNGHLRQVNIHNVREWVHLAKKFILHDGVVEQALAFKRGVDDFFPSEYLSIFTASELQRDVCGGGDKVDRWTEDEIKSLLRFDGGRGATEALVAVAAMGGEGGASLNRRFGSSSPTIGYLVRTLLESSPTQRRQFLSFTTSVPIVTPGKIEVVPMVSPMGEFLPMRDPGCLPRANTCARRLYLPRFEDYETFSQVLRAVILEESKFKGFYEWRG